MNQINENIAASGLVLGIIPVGYDFNKWCVLSSGIINLEFISVCLLVSLSTIHKLFDG